MVSYCFACEEDQVEISFRKKKKKKWWELTLQKQYSKKRKAPLSEPYM